MALLLRARTDSGGGIQPWFEKEAASSLLLGEKNHFQSDLIHCRRRIRRVLHCGHAGSPDDPASVFLIQEPQLLRGKRFVGSSGIEDEIAVIIIRIRVAGPQNAPIRSSNPARKLCNNLSFRQIRSPGCCG